MKRFSERYIPSWKRVGPEPASLRDYMAWIGLPLD